MSAVLAPVSPKPPPPRSARPPTPRLGGPRRFRLGSDWWDALGNVPLDRVVFDPPPGTVEYEDYLRLGGRHDGWLVELVDNTLVRKPMGMKEDAVGMEVGGLLRDYKKKHATGALIIGAQGMTTMRTGNVRYPDAGYVSSDDLDREALDRDAAPSFPITVAVEVISPSNTAAEIRRKIGEYFDAGTKLVWVLHPAARLVDVYTSPTAVRTLRAEDVLDGGDVLPGFAANVGDLFDV